MQPVIPQLTFERLRQAKKYASKSLESLDIKLSSSTTGNLVANIFGFSDWNTAKAMCYEQTNEAMKKHNTSSLVYKSIRQKILSNALVSMDIEMGIAEVGIDWLIDEACIALEWHVDINMWNPMKIDTLDEFKAYLLKGILITLENILATQMGIDNMNDISIYVDQPNGERHLNDLALSNSLYDDKMLAIFGVDETQFLSAMLFEKSRNKSVLNQDIASKPMRNSSAINSGHSFSAEVNHSISHKTMFPKKSKEFDKTAGYFESIGHSELDSNDIATIAVQYGINDNEPLEYMSKDETIACLVHAWQCRVLKFLDEDKKNFNTEFFHEYLNIHDLGGPTEKAMERYLKMLETSRNDLETFKPFLRQLGVKQVDVEIAIGRYFDELNKKAL